jgi:GT2 family glycosyltransferase
MADDDIRSRCGRSMKLSVIIVNYNVRAYLEQCLRTVFTALEGVEGEVFVVDNLSTDGSVDMVRDKFPQVELIANQENVGFSRANNQAIRVARGEYVLLLNPDTVVGEDVFHKVITFLDEHPKAGGLGVKMVDGTGRFLPESKRGLPTPQVAFFKIIGLTRLFPRSRIFGRYHLGHLPENSTAPIEILSGACMFLRRETLDKVGLLDESFFMYGEDIDLSYRITLGGYENWYFHEARIIHYKGESTKKSSVNYVFVFYNAMAIFAQKHFTSRSAGIFPWLINGSIYLSAAGAIGVRFLNRTLLPILDLLLVMLVLSMAVEAPRQWPLIGELGMDLLMGSVVVAWAALFGAYDRPLRFLPPLTALGSLLLLALLARPHLAPMHDTLGMALPFLLIMAGMLLLRFVLKALRIKGYELRRKERERVLAVGSAEESRHALALLWQTHFGLGWTGVVPPENVTKGPDELRAMIDRNRVGEVVFCAKDLPWRVIIERLEQLRDLGTVFKIAQPGREFIIGPSSIESLQDLYLLNDHALSSPAARRVKRLLDVAVALLLLLAAPLAALVASRPRQLLGNAWEVLRGRKSWVGYQQPLPKGVRLPAILPGVFDTGTGSPDSGDQLAVARTNATYAKDYSPWEDLKLLLRGIRSLGRG